MYTNGGGKSPNLLQFKTQLLSSEIDGKDLPSSTIRDLMEILDWTIIPEKKIIISLCKIVSKRGEIDVLTEEH